MDEDLSRVSDHTYIQLDDLVKQTEGLKLKRGGSRGISVFGDTDERSLGVEISLEKVGDGDIKTHISAKYHGPEGEEEREVEAWGTDCVGEVSDLINRFRVDES